MKYVIAGTIVIMVLAGPVGAGGGEPVTIRGEVICLTCYLKDGGRALGLSHKACAEACYNQGLPQAILQEETGDLFLPITTDMSQRGTGQERFVCSLVEHTPVRVKLDRYFGEMVKITGGAFPGNGVTLLTVKTVAPRTEE